MTNAKQKALSGKKDALLRMDGTNPPCPSCASRGHTHSQHKQMVKSGRITR